MDCLDALWHLDFPGLLPRPFGLLDFARPLPCALGLLNVAFSGSDDWDGDKHNNQQKRAHE
jgi:hypothetical protein